jgi:hypothetical protein
MVVTGAARRNGEPLSLLGHVLRFAISERDTHRIIAQVSTGDGITQEESGRFRVEIPATTMTRNTFPRTEYWWEMDMLLNGDAAQATEIDNGSGPFTLRPSAFGG